MKKEAILFVHGIAGSPCVFDFMKASLPKDVDVFFKTLEGHGEDYKDFSHCRYPLWIKDVERTLLEILDDHEKVFLVGHSMGCLLSLEMVRRHSERISGLFLLCPPIKIGVRIKPMLKTCFSALTGKESKDESVREAHRCSGLPLSKNPFSYFPWAAPFLSLLIHVPKERKKLEKPSVNCVAFVSQKDELVSPKSSKYLERAGIETIRLENSGHYLFSLDDQKTILERWQRFLTDSQEMDDKWRKKDIDVV